MVEQKVKGKVPVTDKKTAPKEIINPDQINPMTNVTTWMVYSGDLHPTSGIPG